MCEPALVLHLFSARDDPVVSAELLSFQKSGLSLFGCVILYNICMSSLDVTGKSYTGVIRKASLAA